MFASFSEDGPKTIIQSFNHWVGEETVGDCCLAGHTPHVGDTHSGNNMSWHVEHRTVRKMHLTLNTER